MVAMFLFCFYSDARHILSSLVGSFHSVLSTIQKTPRTYIIVNWSADCSN